MKQNLAVLAALFVTTAALAAPTLQGAPRFATDLPGGALSELKSSLSLKAEVADPVAGNPAALALYDARQLSPANDRIAGFFLTFEKDGVQRLNVKRTITFHPWGWEERIEDEDAIAKIHVFTLAKDVFAITLEAAQTAMRARVHLAALETAAPGGPVNPAVLFTRPTLPIALGTADGADVQIVGMDNELLLERDVVPGQTYGWVLARGSTADEARTAFTASVTAAGAPESWLAGVLQRWEGRGTDRLSRSAHCVLAMNQSAKGPFPSKTLQNDVTLESSTFQALAAAERDASEAFDLLEEVHEGQLPTGFDKGMFASGSNFDSKLPLQALALRSIYQRSARDDAARARLTRFYEAGKPAVDWWFARRDRDGDGVPELNGSLEGGGPSPRFDEVWGTSASAALPVGDTDPRPRLNAVDLNAWIYLYELELSRMARALGREEEATDWVQRAGRLGLVFEDGARGFWDEERGGYFDYVLTPDRVHVKARTLQLASPLFVGAVRDRTRVRRVIEVLLDPASFNGDLGVPSVAFNDSTFDPLVPGRGAISITQNYLVLLALYRYGFEPEAEQLKQRLLQLLGSDHGVWSDYDARTGKGLGIYGDSAAAAIALLLLRDRHQAEAFAAERAGAAVSRQGFFHRLFRQSDGRILVEVSAENSFEVPLTKIESTSQIFSDEPMTVTFSDPRGELGGHRILLDFPILEEAKVSITHADGSTEVKRLENPVRLELNVDDRVEVQSFRFLGQGGCGGCGTGSGSGGAALAALVIVWLRRKRGLLSPAFVLLLLLPFAAEAAERPRLAILIVIDQLSAPHFDRRVPSTSGGVKRLVAEGFRFRESRFETAPTITSPGHATLATGAYPSIHGVVANEWYDAALKRPVTSTEDPRHRIVGREPASKDGTSPSRLKAGTLGDALKASNARSKVISLAGKDRGAILIAGRSANAVVWFDWQRPLFTTSSYYGEDIPAWVTPVNEKLRKLLVPGLQWSLPRGGFTGRDTKERPFARDIGGYGKSFPHPVNVAGTPAELSEQLIHHPILDELLVDLALGAIKAEQLGADDAPDLLTLSFSGFDKLAHSFGPDSPEVEAGFAQLDLQIGRLLTGVDAAVGKGKYTVVLTSDHGGADVPEVLKDRRIDSGRVDAQAMVALLEKEADAALGAGDWFEAYRAPGFTVKPAARAKIHQADERLREVARSVEGVLDLVPKPELIAGRGGKVSDLYRAGLDAERSPDFILLTRPYWLYGVKDTASHGSFHLYDRSVPLVLFGAGVSKGEGGRAEAIDVAPTLAAVLGCGPPSDSQGRVLEEAVGRSSK